MKGPVLVTGGAGFIGSHVVARLAAQGHEVRVLDPAARAARLPPGVESHAASLLDAAALAKAARGVRTVFHLAAHATFGASDAGLYERVNHLGTRALLKAAAEAGAERVLVTSTALVLRDWRDGGPRPLDETTPRPPLAAMPGPYSRSKWRAETAALEALAEGLPVTLLYPTAPLGPPGDWRTEPTEMLRRFLLHPPPAFLETLLNLPDVEDVAEAHLLAAERGRAGGRYLLAADDLAFSDLLAALAEVSGRAMPRRRIPGPLAMAAARIAEPVARLRGGIPAATVEGVRCALHPRRLDAGLAARELGWRPQSSLDAVRRAARAILDDEG